MMENPLRKIPAVHDLLGQPSLEAWVRRIGHQTVVEHTRKYLSQLRDQLRQLSGQDHSADIPPPEALADKIARWIDRQQRDRLRPVINATGILLHTGLGRAPLADEAIEAVVRISRGYSSLEIDLETGRRSQRVWAAEKLISQLIGAEAATVVNNNAGATLVTLAALAADREVVVSRGELIEIGGSFRLPDVMAQSGAKLREVGTTNKTRLSDYRQAIGPNTAALLKVHTSNYRIVGFTEDVPLKELVALAREHHVTLVHDIGSGALVDLTPWGIHDEPVAARSLQIGADVVLFSGDKLLGGPQCGIIAGRADLVRRIMEHPLSRALRVDKMTLAALVATLRLYLVPDQLVQRLPLLQLLAVPIDQLRERAVSLASRLAQLPSVQSAEAIPDQTYLGGGSVPAQQIPTWCVAVTGTNRSMDGLAAALRKATPAVVARIAGDRLLLDLRSVFAHEDEQIVAAFATLT